MQATDAYRNQFTLINDLLHNFVAELRPGEWEARPAPGTNTVGFTIWHMPAVQDWVLSTIVGGGIGLNMTPEWSAKGMATYPVGFGMSLSEADAIGANVKPNDVLDYADAVLAKALAWLDTTSPEEFERPVATSREHLPLHPAYSSPGYLEEANHMFDYPLWRFLSGACYGHQRGHFGELEVALQIIRSR